MRRSGMRGQLIFEFVIATLFFLAIVMYTISYLNITVFAFSESHQNSMIRNNAWQISELLVKGQGVWSGSPLEPMELGIAESWPVMNHTRITALDAWCGTRLGEMAALLDVDPEIHGTSIKVYRKTASGEESLADCGSPPNSRPNTMVTRFGVLDTDSSLVRIVVWYW